jgi:CheY-like chemotaxis protein
LTFSRRETRSPELVDLNKALEETRKMLRRLLREDIELEIIPGPDLWQVYTDPSQMDQIIMNLAVNARDAMPDGGTLTIETANVELDHAYFSKHGVDNQPGSYVMLAVTDTGVGMTEEVRQKMFDPFFTTKERGTGTGLGLATVYGAVKQNGGYIWAYSEPGQGTTMKVYLPRATEGIAPDRKEHVEVSGLTGEETVLLTEDDDLVRKMIVRFLSKYGYRVLEAANGKEAMEISRQFRGTIHLLITDVIMPGMNGKELSERLRSERPDMKVLFMSGYTQNIIMQKGILPATIHYAQKPFSERTFALKVREVMEEQGE